MEEVACSVRLLKTDGFSSTKTVDRDYSIKSRWSVYGYEWETRIYPAIPMAAGPWVAGVELALLSEPRMHSVTAELRCHEGWAKRDRRGRLIEPYCEKTVSQSFNRAKDYSLLFLMLTPGYLKDHYLYLRCTIRVLSELPDITTIPAAQKPASPSLQQHLAELLHRETGADVTFLVAGESFAAHKGILAARSPVFMAEFFGQMREKSSQHVEVRDMEAAAFKAMLHFIYTDTVPELDQKQEAVMMMAQHLLAAADRYGLDKLKEICERRLSIGIDITTAATTLALAEQFNCSQLKAKCIEFIVGTPETVGAVLATEGFKHLEACCPLVVHDLLKSACKGKN